MLERTDGPDRLLSYLRELAGLQVGVVIQQTFVISSDELETSLTALARRLMTAKSNVHRWLELLERDGQIKVVSTSRQGTRIRLMSHRTPRGSV